MWTSIKSLIRDSKTKCILIEDGTPKYVVLSFDEYQQLQKNGRHSTVEENLQKESPVEEERVNHELQEIKSAAVNIEDLPF